jgi:CTP synthase (UTP-ammonia lyase)
MGVYHMKIGIVGDYNPDYLSQQATNDALIHSSEKLGIRIEHEWIPTASIPEQMDEIIKTYKGFWIAPGSPESVDGVLHIIQYSREHNIPLLGTCGGFQNILIEYARNKLMITEAEHEEQDPNASILVISKLTCSLVGQKGEIIIKNPSKVFGIYQKPKVIEQFRCNYGLNPEYQTQIGESGLRIVGADTLGNPRIIEIPEHKFFIGTLFVPQLSSTQEYPHCLVNSIIEHINS